MVQSFPDGFLWGASTAAHQIEGNNRNSDWWQIEHAADAPAGFQPSGDALDSYHRYEEDMRLLADAGLNAYRFSIEWARVEPAKGEFSRALLAHYRRMIDTALDLGITPVVTLHHFSQPAWFGETGAWLGSESQDLFARYVEKVASILGGVQWVCTINEPNVVALTHGGRRIGATEQFPATELPDEEIGEALIAAHRAAAPIVRGLTDARVGWTIGNQALEPMPGAEAKLAEVQRIWEDMYLEVSREDDFVGVQTYTSQLVSERGIVPHPEHPDNTLMGWAYRPDAMGIAIRHTRDVVGDVPIIVTENGIATSDDERRIAYTRAALGHLLDARNDGIDVRGYLHWSLLDNFEWGRWETTFGLVEVDHETFERRPKPSLAWLGNIASANAI